MSFHLDPSALGSFAELCADVLSDCGGKDDQAGTHLELLPLDG